MYTEMQTYSSIHCSAHLQIFIFASHTDTQFFNSFFLNCDNVVNSVRSPWIVFEINLHQHEQTHSNNNVSGMHTNPWCPSPIIANMHCWDLEEFESGALAVKALQTGRKLYLFTGQLEMKKARLWLSLSMR